MTAASSNQTLAPDTGLVAAGEGETRTLQVATDPIRSGQASITVTVSDGTDTASTTFTVIAGTNGRNVLTGTAGPDLILGKSGIDLIRGGNGDDVLCGGAGIDVLLGGPGDDTLDGQTGKNLLIGGPGTDTPA